MAKKAFLPPLEHERGEPDIWTVRGIILQTTDEAILLQVEGDEYWLPKSQINYAGEKGEVVDVEVPDWLAGEKGLSDGDGRGHPKPEQNAEAGSQDDAGGEGDTPAIDADRTVDIMLTIIAFSEDGETATVQAGNGEPCEISTADFTHDNDDISTGDTLLCHVNTLAAMTAGLVGPDATNSDKGVTWLRKEKCERAFPLDDQEKLRLGNVMAEAQKRIDDLEDELADIRKSFKAKIEQEQQVLSDAAKTFRNGKSEPCMVECNVFQDWNTEELVFVACEDDVEVFRRPMTAEEKQPTLFTAAPGGSAPLGEEPLRRMGAPSTGSMELGHTCVDCGHLKDSVTGQAEECATCSQTVEGGTDNWTPRRECKTCAHKFTAVNMPPCKGCVRNPETPTMGKGTDDHWVFASDDSDTGTAEGADAQDAAGESAGDGTAEGAA